MSDRSRIVLIGGGARSGKSAFALTLARRLGRRRAFVATACARDPEMRDRIEAHVQTRGNDFRTIEEPTELAARLSVLRDVDVVVIDCLTLWLSNLLLRNEPHSHILEEVEAVARVLESSAYHTVVVTNEVGMGVVPATPLGRAFRDLAGHAHQRFVRAADEVYLAVLGAVLRMRPEPVCLQRVEGTA